MERIEKNKYQISFMPNMKGKHQLHVGVRGKPVKGSPYLLTVKIPAEQLSRPIFVINDLMGPRGVAINQKGEVVVTEYYKHSVSILTSNGKKIQSFGVNGSGPGQFEYPIGITVDNQGSILEIIIAFRSSRLRDSFLLKLVPKEVMFPSISTHQTSHSTPVTISSTLWTPTTGFRS